MIRFHSIDIWSQFTIGINCVIAVLLGSVIGWERDRAGKSAGARTMGLVAGACSVIVGIGEVMDTIAKLGDPTRALHAVITGIGFLGAGLIFSGKRGSVYGVTTAATVFATAAMGVAVGLGFQVLGAIFTIVIFAVLRSTQVLERTLHLREVKDE